MTRALNTRRPAVPSTHDAPPIRKKAGAKTRPVEKFPTPLHRKWTGPPSFSEALKLHMERHGDSGWYLYRCIIKEGENFDRSTIRHWLAGSKSPRSVASMEVLGRIEQRYRLPEGYFKAKLPHQARGTTGHIVDDISAAERRRLAWHLPDDFNNLSWVKQDEILEWVGRVVISGSTDYRRFQAAAMKHRYAIRFPNISHGRPVPANDPDRTVQVEDEDDEDPLMDPELISGAIDAPPVLANEMAELIRFKTATLTAFGLQRNGVWGTETASQKVEHLGLMFGALSFNIGIL